MINPLRPAGATLPGSDVDEAQPSPRTGADRPRRRWSVRSVTVADAALGLVLLVGVIAQVRVWAVGRGFWNDELYIALSVRDLSTWQLTKAPKYFQVAPVGWLLAEKAIRVAFGDSERTLRSISVLATLSVLVLTAVYARRVIGRWGSVAATAIVATAPFLLYYAGELKQYALEAAAAMAVLIAADFYGRAGGRRSVAVRAAVWVAVGGLAVLCSYSALIVVSGAALGLGAYLLGRRRLLDAVVLLASSALPAAAAGLLVARRLSYPMLKSQDSFFATGLAPGGSSILERVQWLPVMWRGFVASPLRYADPWLVLAFVVVGLVALVVRRRAQWALVLVGVGVAAVLAAALRRLPLQDRVALYLVAPMAIVLAAGLDGLARGAIALVRAARSGSPAAGLLRGRAAVRTAAVIAVVVAVAAPVGAVLVVQPATAEAVQQTADPRYRDRNREIFRSVVHRIRPGDVVLLYYISQPQGSWYGRELGIRINGLVVPVSAKTCDDASLVRALRGASRVWYLWGARFSKHPSDVESRMVARLADRGRLLEWQVRPGSSGWALVDLSHGLDPSRRRAVRPGGPYSCLSVRPFYK